jgi:hypothetical protein
MHTLSPIRLTILRQIAHEPKPVRHFTHGDYFIGSPAAIATHLRVLQNHGYITQTDDLYSVTRSGMVALDGYAPVSRLTGEVVLLLERRWRADGYPSLAAWRRDMYFCLAYGVEHVARLREERLRRAMGRVGTLSDAGREN